MNTEVRDNEEPNLIHPTVLVGPDVRMGYGNVIGPNVILTGKVCLGNHNWIGPNVCIGVEGDIFGMPSTTEGAWWTNGASRATSGVTLGSRNTIKEGATIHAGSHRDTTVGDSAYLMPRAHLGHDCWLGDHVALSPSAQIAGHASIGSYAVIGMGALIHQFTSVGPAAMVGMGAVVRRAVPPGRTVIGDPAEVAGINHIGLERLLGVKPNAETLQALRSQENWGQLPEVLRTSIAFWQESIIESKPNLPR